MLRRSLYAARRSDLARGARTLATNAPKSGASSAAKKAPAGGEEVDVVKRVFVEQQRKFRALLEKTKTLTPPVGGDAAAVKAYAAKKLAILKEVRRMRAICGTRARRATVDASVEARSQSKPQRSAILTIGRSATRELSAFVVENAQGSDAKADSSRVSARAPPPSRAR
jgi:hypothetical protein